MKIIAINKVKPRTVYAIKTSSGTFIADGLAHHNCWACNFRHVRDQYPYFEWYKAKFGQDRFDTLRREFKTTKKYKTYELVELWGELKTVLDNG